MVAVGCIPSLKMCPAVTPKALDQALALQDGDLQLVPNPMNLTSRQQKAHLLNQL